MRTHLLLRAVAMASWLSSPNFRACANTPLHVAGRFCRNLRAITWSSAYVYDIWCVVSCAQALSARTALPKLWCLPCASAAMVRWTPSGDLTSAVCRGNMGLRFRSSSPRSNLLSVESDLLAFWRCSVSEFRACISYPTLSDLHAHPQPPRTPLPDVFNSCTQWQRCSC